VTGMPLDHIREIGLAHGLCRPAQLGTCAANGCDTDCTFEFKHSTADAVTWVPLCVRHELDRYHGEPLEYIVEVHGFMPRCDPIARVIP
jgi:hypothetical protein